MAAELVRVARVPDQDAVLRKRADDASAPPHRRTVPPVSMNLPLLSRVQGGFHLQRVALTTRSSLGSCNSGCAAAGRYSMVRTMHTACG